MMFATDHNPVHRTVRHVVSRHTRRTGISLIEILMSIGVMLLGLLGVVALIPAGQHRAQQSSLEDRKSQVGRRAIREFFIRSMHEQGRWVVDGDTGADARNPRQSFCVDPRAFAGGARRFPYDGNPFQQSNDPRETIGFMHRISLQSESITSPLGGNGPSTGNAMPLGQAEKLFVVEDDLLFERPSDGTLPTEQAVPLLWWFHDTNKDGQVNDKDDLSPSSRLADGHLSWMATLVPDVLPDSDLYHLSVVVFHKRLTDPTIATSETYPENVVAIGQFTGDGRSGGDLVFDATKGTDHARAHLTSMKPGEWLMLHQIVSNPQNPPDRRSYFRWYRLVAAQDMQSGQRAVTVQGPDWPNPGTGQTAILVRNVVAVYEKTIRLGH